MTFLVPILAPFLLPLAIGTNIMELLTDNASLEGGFFQQFFGFWKLVWQSMTTWL